MNFEAAQQNLGETLHLPVHSSGQHGKKKIHSKSDNTVLGIINRSWVVQPYDSSHLVGYANIKTVLANLDLTGNQIPLGSAIEVLINKDGKRKTRIFGRLFEIKENILTLEIESTLDDRDDFAAETSVVGFLTREPNKLRYAFFCTETFGCIHRNSSFIQLRAPDFVFRAQIRDNERVDHTTACELTPIDSPSPKVIWCTTEDISSGGVCVRVRTPSLKKGQFVNVRLLVDSEFIKVMARVGKVKSNGDEFSVSLIFVEYDAKDRLVIKDFVYKKIGEILNTDAASKLAKPAAWNGDQRFTIVRKQEECDGTVSLYLAKKNGGECPEYEPGQHVTIGIDVPGTGRVYRCYSLSRASCSDSYRITVRRKINPESKQIDTLHGPVSWVINDLLKENQDVWLKAPSGTFVLDRNSDSDVVLIAAGVGITPIFSMLDWISNNNPKRRVLIFVGARNSRDLIFRHELAEVTRKLQSVTLRIFFDMPDPTDRLGVHFDHFGRITFSSIKNFISNTDADFYICGPDAMMISLSADLQASGILKSKLHVEQFARATPHGGNKLTGHGSVEFLMNSGKIAWNPAYESVLELSEKHGVGIPSSCRQGSCGTCKAFLVEGTVKQGSGDEVQTIHQGFVLTCVCVPQGDVKILKV